MDLRCEGKLGHVADMLAHVRERQEELSTLPEIDFDSPNCDELLRDRVLRSITWPRGLSLGDVMVKSQ